MVYRGKPFQGCYQCKIRKLKCDRLKSGCGQCTKSHVKCSGCSGNLDAMSEIQSSVAGEVQPQLIPSGRAMPQNVSIGNTSFTLLSRERRALRISISPQTSVEDMALCHFIFNYIHVSGNQHNYGSLGFVLPLLQVDSHSAFKDALSACSLALFNNRVGRSVLLDEQILRKYAQSLKSINAALHDGVMAKQDGTLASILLLGLYETFTGRHPSWQWHIHGATQLLIARGPEQLNSKLGVELFLAALNRMVLHAVSTAQPLSLRFEKWMSQGLRDEFIVRCLVFSSRASELNAEANDLALIRRSSDIDRAFTDLIEKTRCLNAEIVHWLETLPHCFRGRTVAWAINTFRGELENAPVFPGQIDVYPDLRVASVWNMMRCARLILSGIVIRCTAWQDLSRDYRTTKEYASATRDCSSIISDIIASVPYHFGIYSESAVTSIYDESLWPTTNGEENNPKAATGSVLLWPLSCIMTQDYITEPQRVWVKGRFKFVGSELGIRSAYFLAQRDIRVPSTFILRDREKVIANGKVGYIVDNSVRQLRK